MSLKFRERISEKKQLKKSPKDVNPTMQLKKTAYLGIEFSLKFDQDVLIFIDGGYRLVLESSKKKKKFERYGPLKMNLDQIHQ